MAYASPRTGTGALASNGTLHGAGTAHAGTTAHAGRPDIGNIADQAPAAATAAAGTPGRETARHITGRLSALPRLAAAGAARVRARSHASSAERDAARRDEAREAADSGPGTDWAQVGIFGAGIAVGALIGAGAALLLAPATGFETRMRLAATARRRGARVADRVDDLADDVRRGAKRGKRKVARAVTTSRWVAEDAWARRRDRD